MYHGQTLSVFIFLIYFLNHHVSFILVTSLIRECSVKLMPKEVTFTSNTTILFMAVHFFFFIFLFTILVKLSAYSELELKQMEQYNINEKSQKMARIKVQQWAPLLLIYPYGVPMKRRKEKGVTSTTHLHGKWNFKWRHNVEPDEPPTRWLISYKRSWWCANIFSVQNIISENFYPTFLNSVHLSISEKFANST